MSEPFSASSVTQTDWGSPFHGNREVTAAGYAGAIGFWQADASVSTPSVLTMSATDVVVGSGHGAIDIAYTFTDSNNDRLPIDLTESGENDGLRLDFAFSRGPTPIRDLRILVASVSSGLFFGRIDPLPETEDAFSVFVPFDSFFDGRGGGPGDAFESVFFVNVQFFSAGNSFFPPHDDREWEVGLDRVSIVQSVPEPTKVPWMALFLMVGFARFRGHIQNKW